MPCPSGASKEPMTSPFLSMWIIEGGRVQQSEGGLGSSARSSMSLKSCGRSSTHTLSSLSTASPVTPPIFHLFGKGLGQSGSNLNFGADCSCAATDTPQTNKPRPADTASARLNKLLSLFMTLLNYLQPANFKI